MSAPTAAKCAWIFLFTGLLLGAQGSLRKQVPEAPLPKAASPVEVPVIGSKEPHSANPVVCGVLGGLIVLNWVVGCCCAGGAAAAGSQGNEAGAAGGGGLFACVELLGSLAAIASLVYVIYTGLLSAWLGGQSFGGWCLFLSILATIQLIMCMCICCCAGVGAAIFGEELMHKISRHSLGSHGHDLATGKSADESTPLAK